MARDLLETVGEAFLLGYGFAMECRDPRETEERLERVPVQFRGFAYEGAGMGYTMLDGLPFGGGGRFADFLAGRGDEHVYTAYVGIGWALARLPRFRWRSVEAADPLLRWLVLDGYGFHQAYFHTKKYVHEQHVDTTFPWRYAGEHDEYAARALDQGIGRAMWFVGGTAPAVVADLIDAFPVSRRGDLYSGAGLAATYAAGAAENELQEFRERAGHWRPQLAQGSAFGAEARLRGGIVLPQTEVAAQVLCGTTAREAARVCAETRPSPDEAGDVPAYEIWRQRIAERFTVSGGARTS
jgi:enediyne biosynthesis protein E3